MILIRFRQVATSATIGTFSSFKGTFLANQAITINAISAMDGRALAFAAGVSFNGNRGGTPIPAAPFFTSISRPTGHSAILVLITKPYFPLTLQSNRALVPAVWTTLLTTTPVASLWTYANQNAAASQLFYRAFITPSPGRTISPFINPRCWLDNRMASGPPCSPCANACPLSSPSVCQSSPTIH